MNYCISIELIFILDWQTKRLFKLIELRLWANKLKHVGVAMIIVLNLKAMAINVSGLWWHISNCADEYEDNH